MESRENSRDALAEKIPFVHSVLRAIGEKELTLLELYRNYIGLRPKSYFRKRVTPAASIKTVDIYIKVLVEHGFIEQKTKDWHEGKNVKKLVYSLTAKARQLPGMK